MKKICVMVLALLLTVFLVSCGNSAEVPSDYNAILAEKETLQAQYDDLLSTTKKTAMTISGSFTATVRDLIPDYMYSDTEPTAAVVTLFQGPPFVIRLGNDIVAQLEIGKTYKFEIAEREVELTQDQADVLSNSPEILIPLFNLKIASAVETTENGLDVEGLTISK